MITIILLLLFCVCLCYQRCFLHCCSCSRVCSYDNVKLAVCIVCMLPASQFLFYKENIATWVLLNDVIEYQSKSSLQKASFHIFDRWKSQRMDQTNKIRFNIDGQWNSADSFKTQKYQVQSQSILPKALSNTLMISVMIKILTIAYFIMHFILEMNCLP